MTFFIGFGAGFVAGLWAGFKLWRQTYVKLDGSRNLGGR